MFYTDEEISVITGFLNGYLVRDCASAKVRESYIRISAGLQSHTLTKDDYVWLENAQLILRPNWWSARQDGKMHTDAFLHAARKDSLAAVLAAAPPSPLREKALLLASRAAEQQHALKSSLAAAQGLLEKSRGFIEFHVNLLNQTVASDTYAPPGGSGSESELRRGRRMFDANI